MPLLSVRSINAETCLGIWKITETEQWFLHNMIFPDSLNATLSNYKSESRRLEVLATYALLQILTNDNTATITHNSSGKPLSSHGFISISHTKDYVALILSTNNQVAIDIEYISNRVEKIRHKFLREEETPDSLFTLLLHWTAKETLYKYASECNLAFSEMRVLPFALQNKGIFYIENLKLHTKHPVYYETNDHFIITYMVSL